MNSDNQFWKSYWNEVANNDEFSTLGRKNYTLSDFLVYVSDIVYGLENLSKNDVILDVGGGAGFLSMALAPHCKKIYLCDFSEKLVQRACIETKSFNSITCYQDDVTRLKQTKTKVEKVDKIVCGSVFQYLENYAMIRSALTAFHQVLKTGGLALITHNPDIQLKQEFIRSYELLDWPAEKKENAVRFEQNDRFWLDFTEINDICKEVGFRQCKVKKINSQLFQSTHMFDFIVVK